MLDEDKFVGAAMKEIKEEAGIILQTEDLIDLTLLAHGDKIKGIETTVGLYIIILYFYYLIKYYLFHYNR
jgi:8-oxo-dGTP pyrophosphatase MutT (NUDIX family)